MTRDEASMLPRWVAHYGDEVGLENLIVFDDNSQDGSTDDLPCTVHRLPELPGLGAGFERARMRLFNGISQGLLASYDVVIATDVDEFLIANPSKYSSLVDFATANSDRDVIAPVALNVVHHPRLEGPLDPERPILDQRRFAKFVPQMCKPAIKRIPAPWRRALHAIETPFAIHPDLFMLHMKFSDRESLRTMADLRHGVLDSIDHSAVKASWRNTGDEMVGLLDRFVTDTDPDQAPEFDPGSVNLAIVREVDNGCFRARGDGQLTAMQNKPLVRIPEQLLGRV